MRTIGPRNSLILAIALIMLGPTRLGVLQRGKVLIKRLSGGSRADGYHTRLYRGFEPHSL